MIGLILSLALYQTPPLPIAPGPDLSGRVAETFEMCGARHGFRADPIMGFGPKPASPPTTNESRGSGVVHGIRYTTLERLGSCTFNASGWLSNGDRIAEAVADGLSGWSPAFTVIGWRLPESGTTVRTTFEQRDAEGRLIGIVRMVEPTDGTRGEMSISYETVTS